LLGGRKVPIMSLAMGAGDYGVPTLNAPLRLAATNLLWLRRHLAKVDHLAMHLWHMFIVLVDVEMATKRQLFQDRHYELICF
jgi:hypothetical protein